MIKGKITYEGIDEMIDFGKFKRSVVAAAKAVITWWHTHRFPVRFTPAGFQVYGIDRPSGKYLKKRRRAFNAKEETLQRAHIKRPLSPDAREPFVWSGTLRDQSRAAIVPRVTKNGAWGWINVPDYIMGENNKKTRDKLVFVRDDENEKMAKMFEEMLLQKLRRGRGRRVKAI